MPKKIVTKPMVANSMDNLEQTFRKFMADLELMLSQDNTAWSRGYYKGQIDAYKIALMLLETETLLKSVAQRSETLNNGGK